MHIHTQMTNALRQLNALYENFQKKLKQLPAGSLYMVKRKNSSYYYRSIWHAGKKTNIYLNPRIPADMALIEKLWRRRFIQSSLRTLNNNIHALSSALKKFQPYDPAEISANLPAAYQGISKTRDLALPQLPELSVWKNEPYLQNTSYPEELIHETACGIFVRSKSESMILDLLHQLHIPFRYEPLITAFLLWVLFDFRLLRFAVRAVQLRFSILLISPHFCVVGLTLFQLFESFGDSLVFLDQRCFLVLFELFVCGNHGLIACGLRIALPCKF